MRLYKTDREHFTWIEDEDESQWLDYRGRLIAKDDPAWQGGVDLHLKRERRRRYEMALFDDAVKSAARCNNNGFPLAPNVHLNGSAAAPVVHPTMGRIYG